MDVRSIMNIKCVGKKSTWQWEKKSLKSQGWGIWVATDSSHLRWDLNEEKEPVMGRCGRTACQTEGIWRDVAKLSLTNSRSGQRPYGESSCSDKNKGKRDTKTGFKAWLKIRNTSQSQWDATEEF